MKMRLTVILCLSIWISLVLLVKCDEEEALNIDDEGEIGNNEVDSGTDREIVEKEFDTNEEDVVTDDDGGDSGGDNVDDDDDDDQISLKCLVCKAVIETMLYEVEKVDPRKRIDVTTTKSIQYSKSESYLSELMEDLCEYEDTFAILRQVLVQRTIIKKMLKNNGAIEENPHFSPESISTENLNYLCLEVLGEQDDTILKEFMKEELPQNIDQIVCIQTAKYCDIKETPEDNNDRDEL